MKVIAGKAKGVRLKGVSGKFVRPLSSKVKEALFNILGELSRKKFLDLFAGTGQVGVEALSRGADSAVFIEIDRSAVATIEENLLITSLREKGRVIHSDVKWGIRKLHREGTSFDIIFIAPPQFEGLIPETLLELSKRDILSRDGVIVTQSHPNEELPEECSPFIQFKRRKYGDTILSFYSHF
jgi:16S rRNA (guanine(966)-N(2))-methyltransferase RsmD